jgi:DNA-binding transcriptional MocR family regulator
LSSRALVERYQVSPVTVSRALARLVAEGLVVTRPGAGAFRAHHPSAEAPPAGDTSQEVILSAHAGAERVPRAVDASGVPVPDRADERALGSAALRAGVAVAPGRSYFSAEPSAGRLWLSFAAVAGPTEITEGVRRLRTACDVVLG